MRLRAKFHADRFFHPLSWIFKSWKFQLPVWCRLSGVSTQVDRGTCPPDFRPAGDSHAKVPSPTHFLTHNDAIAGFAVQSLGLPAYACIRQAVQLQ